MDLKANTAVDILIGPFVDSTDGVTAETGLTIAQADVRLSKNGQNMAQKNDATSCVHDELGYYNCELDATDTNTEGILVVAISESGALPVRHSFNILSEAAWDSLYAAKDTGYMDVNVRAISDDETAANNCEAFFDGTGYAGTNNTIPTVTTVTNQVTADVTAISGDTTAADNLELDYDGTGYNKSNSTIGTCTTNTDMVAEAPTAAANADAVWDEAKAGHVAAGSFGEEVQSHSLSSEISALNDFDPAADTVANVTLVATTTNLTNAATNGDLTATMKASVNTEVDTALSDINLDHLCAVATAGADMTTEVVDNSILSRVLANGDTSAFDPSTDGLQPIRDRGDAAWTTGGGSGLTALASGTAQSGTASTIVLAASSAFADNVLNGNVINIHTGTGAGQSRVILSNTLVDDTCNVSPNWTTNPGADSQYEIVQGSTNTAAISLTAQTANDNGADINEILVDTNSLNDTKIPNTLNTTASGNIGIDWANVENPTTAVDLSATDIQLCDTITTYTGNTAQTGDSYARLGAPAGASVSADIADVPTVAEFNARTLASADYVVTSDTIAGVTTVTNLTNAPTSGDLTATMKTSVNAEVADVIKTDTVAEMSAAAPPASPTIEEILNYLYRYFRNKRTQTATTITVRDDADSADIFKATISDDTVTFTKEEFVSG